MSTTMSGKRTRVLGVLFGLILLAMAVLLGIAWAGAQEQDAAETAQAQHAEESEPVANDVAARQAEAAVVDSFVAHGSEYGKSETVAVKTDLAGTLDSISVDEWIKNPEGLKAIDDASNLQNIVADEEDTTFKREGESLTWKTGGNDVRYSGTTAAELPFAVSYRYELDGKEVGLDELKGATGRLTVHIGYENRTSAHIDTPSGSYDVQDPFVMASIISFDAEHARNVEVDNGTVVDQQGALMAVGVGMPGLGRTLDIEDMADFPESVTVTADVKGFDMPDITTVATDQLLGRVDAEKTADVRAQVDDAIGQLDNIATAVKGLSKANKAIAEATGKISEGQAAMAENLPNATQGITALADVAAVANSAVTEASEHQGAIAKNEAASAAALQQAVESQEAAIASQDEAAAALVGLPLDDARASQEAALDSLKGIDAETLDDAQKQAVETAIGNLEASIDQTGASVESVQTAAESAQTSLEAARGQLEASGAALKDSADALAANAESADALAQGLGAAATQTENLSTGLTKAGEGFGQVQEGVQQLSTALSQVSEGAKKLSTASSKMSKGVNEAIDTIQATVNEKIDLVNGLSDYVKNKPAFGGSAAGMPANTLYIVHAKSDPTPLRD